MRYTVPDEFYYRVHHIRPRFKNNIENVLIYIATEIANIGEKETSEFNELLNDAIRLFPGNLTKEPKTIDNWRTEISSLFGFIQSSKETSLSCPGLRATELADKQDLIHSFKLFLYHFQYPGGHLKPHETKKLIEEGVRFKPTKYILQMLEYAEKTEDRRVSINAAEATHCILNDLRVIRDGRNIEDVWELIKNNRDHNLEYDWTGDIIRYAGDILDYMEIANLLESHGRNFYINNMERAALGIFVKSDEWFNVYDSFIDSREVTLEQVNELQEGWFNYVNSQKEEGFFDTDILALLSESTEEYELLRCKVVDEFLERVEGGDAVGTKDIGDMGENLVHGHECMRVKIGGREDIIHLIKLIPNHFAVGYDIQSVELDETKRLVEVKTTISSRELNFAKFHLTSNEWKTAESYGERYYVYRLLLSKGTKRLFLLQDPVGKYKEDKLKMIPRDGVDVTFKPDECGEYQELLEWKK